MADQQMASKIEEYIEKIHYSDRYSDDHYEYRHVILPKPLLKLIPKQFFNTEEGTLRLLSEQEWRGIGITQSLGWEHYEVHGTVHSSIFCTMTLNFHQLQNLMYYFSVGPRIMFLLHKPNKPS
ncbi:hypothetical protein ID866_3613 [Astraeus odoratus]|nr:hypothetical protein ID866_3613 [Astraeus odoratus]